MPVEVQSKIEIRRNDESIIIDIVYYMARIYDKIPKIVNNSMDL